MSYIGATMTLPGIAGFVLTMGIGVDSNVLIFERIKEELHGGRSVRQAIDAGFSRVLTTLSTRTWPRSSRPRSSSSSAPAPSAASRRRSSFGLLSATCSRRHSCHDDLRIGPIAPDGHEAQH